MQGLLGVEKVSEPQLRVIYLPIGVLEQLERIAPVRRYNGHARLFGVILSPNRTIPQDSWAALYNDDELLVEHIKEENNVKIAEVSLP